VIEAAVAGTAICRRPRGHKTSSMGACCVGEGLDAAASRSRFIPRPSSASARVTAAWVSSRVSPYRGRAGLEEVLRGSATAAADAQGSATSRRDGSEESGPNVPPGAGLNWPPTIKWGARCRMYSSHAAGGASGLSAARGALVLSASAPL
jgi:hypothetical protein